jgi:hypothetical protein
LERDRGLETGSVPSVSQVVSTAEKIEDAEVAEGAEHHFRRVISHIGDTIGEGRLSSFGTKQCQLRPFVVSD